MAQRGRWPRAGLSCIALAVLGAGCAHTRLVFYPPAPRRLARRVHGPLDQAGAPATKPQQAEGPKPGTVVKVH